MHCVCVCVCVCVCITQHSILYNQACVWRLSGESSRDGGRWMGDEMREGLGGGNESGRMKWDGRETKEGKKW